MEFEEFVIILYKRNQDLVVDKAQYYDLGNIC